MRIEAEEELRVEREIEERERRGGEREHRQRPHQRQIADLPVEREELHEGRRRRARGTRLQTSAGKPSGLSAKTP